MRSVGWRSRWRISRSVGVLSGAEGGWRESVSLMIDSFLEGIAAVAFLTLLARSCKS
jgi:hypothetical protein